MTRTGQTVTLKVAKQGAFYHGLATLLSQPSPIMQRGKNSFCFYNNQLLYFLLYISVKFLHL